MQVLNVFANSFAVDIPSRVIVLVTGALSYGLLFRFWL
jgi:hypothetical protein